MTLVDPSTHILGLREARKTGKYERDSRVAILLPSLVVLRQLIDSASPLGFKNGVCLLFWVLKMALVH